MMELRRTIKSTYQLLAHSLSMCYTAIMGKRRRSLSDQVRRAVDDSGMSRYRICKELDLAEPTMSRFMNRKGGLSMDTLDALSELLDLNITTGKRKPKGR